MTDITALIFILGCIVIFVTFAWVSGWVRTLKKTPSQERKTSESDRMRATPAGERTSVQLPLGTMSVEYRADPKDHARTGQQEGIVENKSQLASSMKEFIGRALSSKTKITLTDLRRRFRKTLYDDIILALQELQEEGLLTFECKVTNKRNYLSVTPRWENWPSHSRSVPNPADTKG